MFSKLKYTFALIWLTGAGRVKIGSSSNTEEQQQLKKHRSISGKQRQSTSWTGAGKVPSAEGAVSKRQSCTEQPASRPSRDPSTEPSDGRSKHHQQQPVMCQVESAVSNVGAFLLLSQVN